MDDALADDKLPCPDQPRCTDDEWRAYWQLLQIKGLTSPGFVCRVNLAHELGLLTPLLAGDLDTAEKLASERIEYLSAQIRWVYPADGAT